MSSLIQPAQRNHQLRLGWTKKKLEELATLAKEWAVSDQHRFWLEIDPQDATHVLFLCSAVHPPADPFVLLIADCLHNMRAALDLLAFELASAYTIPLPDDVTEDSEFPIVGNVNRKGQPSDGATIFTSAARKIRGMDPHAQAVVNGLQPYHQGGDFRINPLWQLNNLERISKHRLLHPVAGFSGGLLLDVPYRDPSMPPLTHPFGSGTLHVYTGVVEQNTLIARIPANHALGDPNVEMKIRAPLQIVFDIGVPGVELQPVIEVLVSLFNHLVIQVVPKLESFL
jgi:hypothetical protein